MTQTGDNFAERTAVWELNEENEVIDLGSEGTRTRNSVSGATHYTDYPD